MVQGDEVCQFCPTIYIIHVAYVLSPDLNTYMHTNIYIYIYIYIYISLKFYILFSSPKRKKSLYTSLFLQRFHPYISQEQDIYNVIRIHGSSWIKDLKCDLVVWI